MAKQSAGLLLYRGSGPTLEVFLVHPGGPFWRKKDAGAWTIPKGEINPGEEPLTAAIREFGEETGKTVTGDFQPLPPCRQAGGKIVQAWAIEGDIDPAKLVSNHFELEWPPRSGKQQSFPEIDRGAWYSLSDARRKINQAQAMWLDALPALIAP